MRTVAFVAQEALDHRCDHTMTTIYCQQYWCQRTVRYRFHSDSAIPKKLGNYCDVPKRCGKMQRHWSIRLLAPK